MTRRKPSDKPAETAVHKPPTRVPRRRRRKPAGATAHAAAPVQARGDGRDTTLEQEHLREVAAQPVVRSRAPRPAEPPPANPDVFSYTFRIWKST